MSLQVCTFPVQYSVYHQLTISNEWLVIVKQSTSWFHDIKSIEDYWQSYREAEENLSPAFIKSQTIAFFWQSPKYPWSHLLKKKTINVFTILEGQPALGKHFLQSRLMSVCRVITHLNILHTWLLVHEEYKKMLVLENYKEMFNEGPST